MLRTEDDRAVASRNFGLTMKLLLLTVGIAALLSSLSIESAKSACDPSYPNVCIAPPPPDLDCADVEHQNFAVRQPDPHRFDGDKDGIGCETP